MRVADFDFRLPPERIALRPVVPRDAARMLVVQPDALDDCIVRDLPCLLRAGDALVFNDTRVLPTQLFARRGKAAIGVTLIERAGPLNWWAFVRNARRLATNDRLEFGPGLSATFAERRGDGACLWAFKCVGPFEAALDRVGQMPLPPYIAARRPADTADRADYQTVYAVHDGSVAAPTAGLHFTPELLAALDHAGIMRETVTLHVGPGTFLPVKADDTADHVMHAEWGTVSAETAARLNAVRTRGGRVIAVGTTAARLIETAAADGTIRAYTGETAIFIAPGYTFRAIDGLMTNFHLPRSTLFMLVSALMGRERMLAAYAHAIAGAYRFYSYGDASLLLAPKGTAL